MGNFLAIEELRKIISVRGETVLQSVFTHLHSKTENDGEYDGRNLPLHISSSVSASSKFKYLSTCHKNPNWKIG